jgi:hypothetical protein
VKFYVCAKPYLSGQPFEPETARNRVTVFEAVCDASCDHKAAQTVAKIIIGLEQRGVRDAAATAERGPEKSVF